MFKKVLRSLTGKQDSEHVSASIGGQKAPTPLRLDVGSSTSLDPLHSDMASGLASQGEQVITQCESDVMALAQRGTTDGQEGKPAADSSRGHTEDAITTRCEHANSQVTQLAETGRDRLHAKIRTANDQEKIIPEQGLSYELIQERRRRQQDAALTIPNPPDDPLLKKLMADGNDVSGIVTLLDEERKQKDEELQGIDATYHDLMETYNHRLPKRPWYYPVYTFFTVIFLLSFIEVGANFQAFQEAGIGSNLVAAIVAAIYAIFQAISAKEFGIGIQRRKKKQWKGGLAVTLILCSVISYFRIKGVEDTMIGVLWVSFNFSIAGLTARLAALRERHRELFEVIEARQSLSKRVVTLEHLSQKLEADYQKRCEAIEEDIAAEAEQMRATAGTRQQQREKKLEVELDRVNDLKERYLAQIEAVRTKALNQYQMLNEAIRGKYGHPPVKRWGNAAPSMGKVATWLVPILFLFLTSCAPELPPTHIYFLHDRTEATESQNVEAHVDYIMGFTEIGKNWGETHVSLSTIGDISTQATYKLTLQQSESFATRVEKDHQQKPVAFRDSLRNGVTSLMRPGDGLGRSYIHRNLYYCLTDAAQQEGNRIVICRTDLLSNEPELNLYRYRENPRGILEDRDRLLESITARYPLPDLTGIRIVVIHQPTKDTDELFEMCKIFFGDYWRSLGADVEFHTNIPGEIAHIPSLDATVQ